VGLYTDTSKLKWIFWTSHDCVLLIDMFLKSRRNLRTKTRRSSDLQIRKNQSMVNMALITSLQKTSPSQRKIRVMERRRRTLENGVIFTKTPGTTPMNVAQKLHWWLRSKIRSRTLIHNMIHENTGRRHIIDADPTAIVMVTVIQSEEPTDLEEGERLFHS
jgi:hypothetical protein